MTDKKPVEAVDCELPETIDHYYEYCIDCTKDEVDLSYCDHCESRKIVEKCNLVIGKCEPIVRKLKEMVGISETNLSTAEEVIYDLKLDNDKLKQIIAAIESEANNE